jgi:hypothetical protein
MGLPETRQRNVAALPTSITCELGVTCTRKGTEKWNYIIFISTHIRRIEMQTDRQAGLTAKQTLLILLLPISVTTG